MATEQDFRDRVCHLLASPAAGKIDLTLGDIHFKRAYFGLVGLAILWQQFGFKGIGFRPGQVSEKADARYSPEHNVYDVPNWDYGTTPYQRQAIVHESIHAYLDMIHSKKTSLTEEALGYVGGVLFHIHDTTPAGKTPPCRRGPAPRFTRRRSASPRGCTPPARPRCRPTTPTRCATRSWRARRTSR